MGRGRNQRRGDDDTMVSKAMSKVLRHSAQEEGLKIDSRGYVDMRELIQYLRQRGLQNINEERIQKIVAGNDKQRFQILEEKHHSFIRATQGHTMKCVATEDLLTKITGPGQYPVVVHGTFSKFWPLIEAGGLKRMTRNHIHFAPGLPKEEGVVSGMRAACDIIIEIDLPHAMKDGIDFYISDNNVILTEGLEGVLPPKYFRRVSKRNGGVILEREAMKVEVEVKPEGGQQERHEVEEKQESKPSPTHKEEDLE